MVELIDLEAESYEACGNDHFFYRLPLIHKAPQWMNTTINKKLRPASLPPHIRMLLEAELSFFFTQNTATAQQAFFLSPYVWTVKCDSKTLRVDVDFLKLYGEKIFGIENIQVRVDMASLRRRSELVTQRRYVTSSERLHWRLVWTRAQSKNSDSKDLARPGLIRPE